MRETTNPPLIHSCSHASLKMRTISLRSAQPLALSETRPAPSTEIADKTNRLIAMLKAGKEARHLVLDWGAAISHLSKPNVGEWSGVWRSEVIRRVKRLHTRFDFDFDFDFEQNKTNKPHHHLEHQPINAVSLAKSFGGVCPRAFLLECIECFEDALPDLNSKIGQEQLNWALHCSNSYTTTLKAHVLYMVTGKPAGIGTLHALTKEAAFLFAELEKQFLEGGGGSSGGSSSTAHFQLTNRCMACLNSIEKLVETLGAKVEVTSVCPSVIFVALIMLRSAQSGYDLRFFHYGLNIFSKVSERSERALMKTREYSKCAKWGYRLCPLLKFTNNFVWLACFARLSVRRFSPTPRTWTQCSVPARRASSCTRPTGSQASRAWSACCCPDC